MIQFFLFLNGTYVVIPRYSRLDGAVLIMSHSVFWRGVVKDCPWVVPLTPSYLDPFGILKIRDCGKPHV